MLFLTEVEVNCLKEFCTIVLILKFHTHLLAAFITNPLIYYIQFHFLCAVFLNIFTMYFLTMFFILCSSESSDTKNKKLLYTLAVKACLF